MPDLDALIAAARGASIRREVADGYVRELERWAPRHHRRSWWPIGLGVATLAAAAAAAALVLLPPKEPAPVAVIVPHVESRPAASAPVIDAPIVETPPAPTPARSHPRVVAPPIAPPPPVVPIVDRWHEARLLRGQGRFADAVTACVAIADAADATWSPIALVEAIRIELGPLASPEQALALSDRMLHDWPSNALTAETRALRCQALAQLGRACVKPP